MLKLENYIKKNLKKGFSEDEIKTKLLESNYPESVIQEHFVKLKKKKFIYPILILILILILVLSYSLFIYSNNSQKVINENKNFLTKLVSSGSYYYINNSNCDFLELNISEEKKFLCYSDYINLSLYQPCGSYIRSSNPLNIEINYTDYLIPEDIIIQVKNVTVNSFEDLYRFNVENSYDAKDGDSITIELMNGKTIKEYYHYISQWNYTVINYGLDATTAFCKLK